MLHSFCPWFRPMLFLVCMESLIKGGDSLCPYILSQLLQLLYITLQTTCHNKLLKNMFFHIWSFYPFHSHFQKELFSFDNAWLNWPLYKWKMEKIISVILLPSVSDFDRICLCKQQTRRLWPFSNDFYVRPAGIQACRPCTTKPTRFDWMGLEKGANCPHFDWRL